MRRAEVQKPQGPLTIKSYDAIPQPPEIGAVIKTQFCGVCHSDLHMWENSTPQHKFPIVYGHEVAGKIFSFGIGADHGSLKVGDSVMVYPWVGCGACEECHNGRDNLCMDRLAETGCGADGGYSNYVSVKDTKFLVKIPDSVPVDVACMLPCSGLTSYSAVGKIKHSIASTPGKKHVLVIGAGGLGLWCLQWAKLCLPKDTTVVCADINADKLKIAQKHGADDTFLWSTPADKQLNDKFVTEAIQRSSGGFDAIIDFVNSSVTSGRSFASLKKGGIQVAVGLFDGSLTLHLPDLVRDMKKVTGSYTGSLEELRELVELVSGAKAIPPPVIHYDLDDVSKAWKLLIDGEMPGRAILKY